MSPQRLLLLAFLLWIAWRLVRNLIRDKITKEAKNQLRKEAEQADETTVQDILVEDPVCHTLIPQHQAIRLRQDGKTYYFCSDSCCDQFTGEPGGKE
ncbi:MAG: YHS domain-containing protein [Candidatus Electrothrix aestuarii]|jgi:YHS domain-containing protein|uniref:YHS domain-containing protein n=1 Tax=Candidatus Electrothrix aestuarii TaxID=3062594 RepID=A0AAU8LZ78_9BACT|nr:YHS domain-containing protein [Candidatus Electrothrix aestuarii]WPD23441.1 MAG: YHS domain-containing protein [Candidatus Electrothrix sp. GW3-3]